MSPESDTIRLRAVVEAPNIKYEIWHQAAQ